ncbi:Aste57867_24142 [Aphanomyces stellatus]|uniref:Aste57867_24142 protein n=1 Tax=Aphanomyces stellatus TaxID=120398 RepID=A0A485KDN3_9STRA|nr:hypothetical protein As57867_024068 [Aphanomyces stellatus]KAF0715285.1 hypothetical protein As57867_003443 [Aphanomyces stellatus]KAF0715297.1 hypothetical protein As57867_003455 [Aphanomyces stellatus]VFT80619.1 Aste57867_3453 [Aphanomyces stellatus]VFT80631.1 Aste57867_3465 [Aphanomyces stellatus]
MLCLLSWLVQAMDINDVQRVCEATNLSGPCALEIGVLKGGVPLIFFQGLGIYLPPHKLSTALFASCVMGRMLLRLSTINKRLDQFKILYTKWVSLVRDRHDRITIQRQCLDNNGRVRFVSFLLARSPSLFVDFARTAPLPKIGSMYALTAQAATSDELCLVEKGALAQLLVK